MAGARDLTATYIKGRTQFGRSLAEFQAVAMQIADVYIASRTLDLAAANAAWRLDQGLDVGDDLAVAAYWACTEGPRALRTCHHLHGGMGVDETYPLHHYFSWITDITHALDVRAEAVPVEDPTTKNLELSRAQRAFKAELRDYFTGLADHNEHREMGLDRHGEIYQRVVRQMGEDGWMGVGWPNEYGGHGLGEIEQTIFANEAQYADVHLPAVTLQTVGPTLIRYGSEKQKDLFLKRILAGDVHFAIGYSEPDAGTDLASLRTTARRDGDHYVVNGQKLWTTGGHQADYVWLAVRTDPDAPKHKGISILIVDTTDPGYSCTPIITADGSHHVNATYYNDVRVPVDMLVGEENQGWKLITTQLNHERVMLGPAGRIEGLRDRVVDWATKAGVVDRPDVVALMGQVTAVFRVNELLNWEVARPRPGGRDLGRRRVVVQGLRGRPGPAPARRADPRRAPLRRPVRRGDPDPDGLPRRPGQAEPRAHLRRWRAGGAARADRDVRPRAAAGAAVSAPARSPMARSRARHADHGRGRADQGARGGIGVAAPYPVNQATIGTWLDAMGYDNERFRRGEAPPSMAQVWTMPGLGRRRAPEDPLSRMTEFLTDEGYTAVLGTNCEQSYERYLRVGEELAGDQRAGLGRRSQEAPRWARATS